MKPLPGVGVTLISRGVDTPYSGMLPGLIAGHYTFDEAHIDLHRLARFAGARAVFDEAVGLDLSRGRVLFESRPPISFDLLSIDIGSTPNLVVAGAREHAVPVKPIDTLLARWASVEKRLRASSTRTRIAVVGGGAGGVELILAIQFRLRRLFEREGRDARHLEYHLFTDGPQILPTHNPSVRRTFERVFSERGIALHAGSAVAEVTGDRLRTADGAWHQADEVLWTTEAAAAPWLARSGLAVDDRGFVRVSSTLQSVSHPNVFAAGDVASMVDHPRPKSGVFAVRQGPPLARNLRSALLGQPLERYLPQRRFLSLITTGNRCAVASRGPLALEGEWVWRWKDRIDRRFMRLYNELPEMPPAASPEALPELADDRSAAAAADLAMRCGGCGAKVGASVLTRALRRVSAPDAGDVIVGLDSPDDGAVIRTGETTAAIHTVDFFRAMIDDPYVFGQVAATHALSDVYAMGGEPRSALAIVTIPHGPEARVEETLTELMAGASAILQRAGVALVGGHTSEGVELGAGFSVNGEVDPRRLLRKKGLRPGDRLILTKAIGTGTLFAADMRHAAKGRWIAAAIDSMLRSNRDAACALRAHGATACTDVTGFGLLGHLVEMLKASEVGAEIDLRAVPLLDGAEITAAGGMLSSLQPQNAVFRQEVENGDALSHEPRVALLCDPQTSGGLLAGVPAASAEACVGELRDLGYRSSAVIGAVVEAGGRSLVALRR